jgi:hypothetical protein
MGGIEVRGILGGAMTLLWLLIWFIAGHDALTLSPVNAWAATLILAVGLDLARSGVVPRPAGRRRN